MTIVFQDHFEHTSFSLGAGHDGDFGNGDGCPDENYIMAASAALTTNLGNKFIFSCCSQRSFYATMNE